MKKLATFPVLIFGFFLFQQGVLAAPLILTQDVIPGDFSKEVVDLQNFLYTDLDTRVEPLEVGRYGINTINGVARFQNKYQDTILLPFNRLSTGTAEVMTRFKIAILGITAEPQSLNDVEVRANLKILLSQTLNKLQEEIALRQSSGSSSTQNGVMYFRGRAVPDDVAASRPGRYEISDNEGFFVSDTGDQYHYQLPVTTIKPIDNPVTFDDLFHNYDYLQQLQGEIIYTPLNDAVEPIASVVGNNSIGVKKKTNQPSVGQSIFGSFSQQSTQDFFNTSKSPLLISSKKYSFEGGVDEKIHVFGREFSPGLRGVIYQDNTSYQVPLIYVSESEMYFEIPKDLKTGKVALGIAEHPHSSLEVFIFNKNSCDSKKECIKPKIENKITSVFFDKEIILEGRGFTRYNNTIETPVGVYSGIESVDGKKLSFVLKYPFTLASDIGGNTMDVTIRVLNENGLSDVLEVEAQLDVAVSYAAQKKRGDQKNGFQARNLTLETYLKKNGEEVELINHEGLVTEVRSILSQDGYLQIKNDSSGSVAFGEKQEEPKTGFIAFLKRMVTGENSRNDTFLESIGFVEKAFAASFPYGGRITAAYPCTCSGNWYDVILDPRGVVHSLVVQPGYTRLYAHFNIYTPGVTVVGSYTPITGTCWMYAGAGCFNVPTTGVMDPFPGTGTSPL